MTEPFPLSDDEMADVVLTQIRRTDWSSIARRYRNGRVVYIEKRQILDWISRLRADGATLNEQRQQIGGAFLAIQRITQPLGVTACSLDLPTAINELAQAVRKSAEADGATLRERVEELEEDAEAWRALQRHNEGVDRETS